ncbi:MAG: hypothetical protein JNL53_14780 [Cyclobacteriaceae bacterium]|nr:hypothetical protein [Cyclobacteriaceae bacterium]
MRSFLIGCLLLLAGSKMSAQERMDSIKIEKRITYYFYLQSGMLVGCTECKRSKEVTFSGAMVQGVTLYKRARLGLGVGFDSFYDFSTVPVFGSASWDVFAKKNALFLQFNYGIPLKVWDHKLYDEYGDVKTSAGGMINPMIGYRIRYYDASIALMIGYKFQPITSYYEYDNYIWNPTYQQYIQEPGVLMEMRELNRLMVSISIGWR